MTLKIHHGGALFEDRGLISYRGGETMFLDWVSTDYISLLELEYFAKKLGYALPILYYFKKDRGYNIDTFEQLLTDRDLLHMLNSLGAVRVANVYFCVPSVPLQVDVGGDECTFEQNEVPFHSFPTPNEDEEELVDVQVEDGDKAADDEVVDSEFELSE